VPEVGEALRNIDPALSHVMRPDEIDYVRQTAARTLASIVDSEMTSAALEIKRRLSGRLLNVRLWSAIAVWRTKHRCRAIPVLTADLKTASAEGGDPVERLGP
jgi:hypothetical protein